MNQTNNASAPALAHTAGPFSWVASPASRGVVYLRDARLNAFATLAGDKAEANAELICRAVNSHEAIQHARRNAEQVCAAALAKRAQAEADRDSARASRDELLAALYIALPFVEDMENDPSFKAGIVKNHIKTIRAAIARAEGQP